MIGEEPCDWYNIQSRDERACARDMLRISFEVSRVSLYLR